MKIYYKISLIFPIFFWFLPHTILLAAPNRLQQKIEFGYFGTTGNTNTNSLTAAYRFKYRINRKTKSDFFVDIYYSNRNGRKNNERYRSQYNLYHNYKKELYSFLSLGFLRNTFEGYNQQYRINPGFGYTLIRTKKHKLDIQLGYEFRRNNYTSQPSQNFHYAKGEFKHRYKITKKNLLTSQISFIENLEQAKDFETEFSTNLHLHIVKQLSFKLSFELKFDNLPPQGKKKSDTTTKASIVYSF